MSRTRIGSRFAPICAAGLCAAGLSGATLGLSPVASGAKGSSGAPLVVTGAVAHVRGSSASLDGTVTPGSQTASYYFQYGPTTAYGSQTTPGSLPPGASRVKVGQQVSGFLPGYHYRLVASSLAGTTIGKDKTYKPKTLKGKFTVTKPTAPVVFGSAFTIAGSLTGTGNANRKIGLQESSYPYLEPFVTVGTAITTNSAGAFVFHLPKLTSSTQFRIATLDPRPTYSAVFTEQAAVRVTLKVKTSSSKGLVRLYGTITPTELGARVLVQLRKSVRPGGKSERTSKFSTQFSTVAKHAGKSFSRFSSVVEVRRAGHYRVYVEVKKGPLVAGSSSTVLLAAAATKKKHKR